MIAEQLAGWVAPSKSSIRRWWTELGRIGAELAERYPHE